MKFAQYQYNHSGHRVFVLLLAGLLFPSLIVEGHDLHDDTHMSNADVDKQGSYTRSVSNYQIPDLVLINTEGVAVSLKSELDLNTPVFLNLIFTSCQTVCPVISATLAQFRKNLGAEKHQVKIISVSIDTEYDTPERLKAYAHRYDADTGWQFLTGSQMGIVTLQKALQAYRGDKMSHVPLVFFHGSATKPWIRLEGFVSAADLMQEYHRLTVD
jgi:protein SCO1/2